MQTIRYFRERVVVRHPEAKDADRIAEVLCNRLSYEVQTDGRIRHWGWVLDRNGVRRIMRVVTREDGTTVHNASFDRTYERKLQ